MYLIVATLLKYIRNSYSSIAKKLVTWILKWSKDLNTYFFKEDMQMTKVMSLIIREMQTKIMMRYHVMPIKMVIKKKRWKILTRMWENWNPCMLLVGMQNGTPAMGNSMKVPQKIKIELPYHSAVPLLGIYPLEWKWASWRDISTPMFHNNQYVEST